MKKYLIGFAIGLSLLGFLGLRVYGDSVTVPIDGSGNMIWGGSINASGTITVNGVPVSTSTASGVSTSTANTWTAAQIFNGLTNNGNATTTNLSVSSTILLAGTNSSGTVRWTLSVDNLG